jgi:serine/threonine protein kinase
MAAARERGEPMSADEVLSRHPDLETEAALRLVYEDVCLRREAGLDVDTAEVVRQFPQWRDELQALFDCDHLLRPSGAPSLYPEVGETLGPFRLLDELGRGASGRTYLATDPRLADRPVVVKVIPGDQDEHLALARLRHTHIVPLFSEHSFPERNLRLLCMPDLGGASLAQILIDLSEIPLAERSGKLLVELIDRNTRSLPTPPPLEGPFRRSLEQASYVHAVTWIAACLADALHYAHARGLVHMDVKPSNVLITVDGQPMLLDFHLARGPIKSGDWIAEGLGGTPGWMSPEQQSAMRAVEEARPSTAAIDGRCDIFSLGLLLREMLTGPGTNWESRGARGAIVSGQGSVSPGLADMIQKCVASDAADRYENAATLADDLRRHLNDLPLRGVGNRSARERWQKWRRRHPGAFAWLVTGLSIVVMSLVALALSLGAYRQVVSQIQTALEDGQRARAGGRYDEAIHALESGIKNSSGVPAVSELRRALQQELRVARRGRLAQELHALADLIRFRYGVDLPPQDDAAAIVQHCRAIWEERKGLLTGERGGAANGTDQTIKTDLLELAAVWADLRVQLSAASELNEARRNALAILDQAQAALGPRFAIDLRREALAAALGSDAGSPSFHREPETAWEHYDTGRSYLRSGRLEAAAQEFRLTLDERPQDFWSNFYFGLCSFRLGRPVDAVSAFGACVALRPDVAICRYDRALAHESLGEADRARADYSRAIELDPTLAAARLNRGILSSKAGRNREALDDFERALRIGPADRELLGRIHYNLALVQAALGDRSAAAANAEAALRNGCPEAKRLDDTLRNQRTVPD